MINQEEEFSTIDIDLDEELRQTLLKKYIQENCSQASCSLAQEIITNENLHEIIVNEAIVQLIADQIKEGYGIGEDVQTDDGC